MTSKDSLYANLHALRVPQDAIDYLIALWDVIQFFDDVADNPADVQRKDTDIALWNVLVGMQMNTFLCQTSSAFIAYDRECDSQVARI